jgi:hypothetical protein
MKNIILVIAFCFSSAFIYAQESFEGSWVTPTSKYITVIYEGEYGVRDIKNINTVSEVTIEETIIKKNKNTFVTRVFNKNNGYTVTVKYKLKNKNTIICKFKGDINTTLVYKRLFANKQLKG